MAKAPTKTAAPSEAENKDLVKGNSPARPLSPTAPEDRPSEDTGADAPRAAFTNQPTSATPANLVDNLPPPNPDPAPPAPPPAPAPPEAKAPKVQRTGHNTHVAIRRGYAATLVERGEFVPNDQPVGDWMVPADALDHDGDGRKGGSKPGGNKRKG